VGKPSGNKEGWGCKMTYVVKVKDREDADWSFM
jgi:hypothetical protein